ncbi:MAG: 50S ribosomal protein L25 [Spirochaetes bacterium]|nr:MAG: 50S ribosomal protein L25 [Spirochaetota bacterium]
MEQKTLVAYVRNELKKGRTRRLRREGKIPAIIYGHDTPKPIMVDENEFRKKFHTVSENTIISLKIDSEEHNVLVKDFQEDIVSGKILHIDFYEFESGKTLRTRVPIHLNGAAKGVKEGGLLEYHLHELDIECLPKNLPEAINIDISNMELGEALHVKDIEALEGVKILNSEEDTIAVIKHPKLVAVEEAAPKEVEEIEEEGVIEEKTEEKSSEKE